ncbi:hypothetical protein RRSWK_05190 [Rhodopirellula sp. SWK7]|nr:hypothetical protein RRSWK_05190 [Rhodopirellula sp. SWK7]
MVRKWYDQRRIHQVAEINEQVGRCGTPAFQNEDPQRTHDRPADRQLFPQLFLDKTTPPASGCHPVSAD